MTRLENFRREGEDSLPAIKWRKGFDVVEDLSGHTVLITGGSSGIGLAVAEECARRKMKVALVALPGPELAAAADSLAAEFGASVFSLGIDLTEKDAPRRVFEWSREEGLVVSILVNNAGLAGAVRFDESSPGYSDERILLNVRALVLLTRYFLPSMTALSQAAVLNIGSMAGFYCIPFKSVYSATKAFVITFSRALAEELKHTAVKVKVLCPNGVRTNRGTFSRIESHGMKARMTIIPSERLADLALNRLFRRGTVIIPGFVNRMLMTIGRLTPFRIKQRMLYREFKKELLDPPG